METKHEEGIGTRDPNTKKRRGPEEYEASQDDRG